MPVHVIGLCQLHFLDKKTKQHVHCIQLKQKKTKIKLNNTANLFMTKCGVNSQTNIFKNILSDNLLQSCTYMFTEMIAEVIKVTKNKP